MHYYNHCQLKNLDQHHSLVWENRCITIKNCKLENKNSFVTGIIAGSTNKSITFDDPHMSAKIHQQSKTGRQFFYEEEEMLYL